MVLLALAPATVAGLLSTEPHLLIISFQLPILILTIFSAAFRLHRMIISQMTALSNLERSEFFNRVILESSPDYTLIFDAECAILFLNRPNAEPQTSGEVIGTSWLSLLHPADREAGEQALLRAKRDGSANLTTRHIDADDSTRWFDVSVDTLPGARQLGLATIVAAALIRDERAHGREPVWGADEANHASLRLANRLGFVAVDELWVSPPR